MSVGQSLLKTFVLGLAVALPVFSQTRNMETRVADLERRMTDLERRIAAVEKQKEAAAKPTPRATAPRTSAGTPAPALAVSSATVPISIRLFTKKIHEAGPGEEHDQFGFLFEFKNDGNRDITAMKGDIILKNLAAEELLVFAVNVAKYLTAGDKTTWYGGIPYDSNNTVHRAILEMPIEHIVVEVKFSQIVYSDGAIKTFE